MELKIMNPQEGGFAKEIRWNNEELKTEISSTMKEYEGIVFTEDTIKDAKRDRAKLNKLKTAFEDERKRIKKEYMDPYNKFEAQVKEVVALIERPIAMIDAQIKEVEENRRIQKRKDIEELFQGIGFQDFVTLEKIFDTKWLNTTTSLTSIESQMKEKMFQIGSDIFTINKLPDFSFEALETYKMTLDLGKAISEGQRLSEIQKRKEAQETERKRLQEEENNRRRQEIERGSQPVVEKVSENMKVVPEVPVYTIDFRVTATAEQLEVLKKFLTENKITYGPVQEKGE